MGERRSFILYIDYAEQIEMLTIEQRGILLTAIMAFQTGEDLPDMDPMTKLMFSVVSGAMRRDNEKYEETIEKRREAGRKGGLATQANKANQANATFASFASNGASKQNQANQANQADSVSDSDSESVNVSESVSVSDNVPYPGEKSTTTTTHTPTDATGLVAGVAYAFSSRKYKPEPGEIQRFIEYNEGLGWKKPMGDAVDIWIANAKKKKQPANKFINFDQHDYDDAAIEAALLRKQLETPVEEM